MDAALVLGLPHELPQTVEEINEEALAAGRLIVKTLPDHPEAHVQMAFTCLQLGQDREALESWRDVLAKDERYSAAYLGMGAILETLGEDEEAIAAFRKGIELNPQLEQAYCELTKILLRTGEADEALSVARESVRQFPGSCDNHFWLGQANLQLEKYENALKHHEEAVRIDPEFTRSYHSLASICARLGRKEEATAHRRRFAALKEKDLEADRDQARDYDDFLTQRLALVKRHVLVGVLQMKAGDPTIAEAHWLRAGALNSEDLPTRKALANLYEEQSRAGAALQVLDELNRLESTNPEYLVRKGRLLFKRHSWQEAEAALNKAIVLDPKSGEAHLILAQVHLSTGADLRTAEAHAATGARLSPSPDSLSVLAAVRAECGDLDGAQAALKQALSMDPKNRKVRQAYEQLLATD